MKREGLLRYSQKHVTCLYRKRIIPKFHVSHPFSFALGFQRILGPRR